MSEDQLQATCWQWAWNFYPITRRCLWAVPNGGSRNKAEACKFQATGVLPGVWDMHFFWKGNFYIFEFKVGTNTLSKPQEAWGKAMGDQGAIGWEIRTFESFKTIFEKILNNVYE